MPETIDIREELKKIMDLQEIDSQIFDLKAKMEFFPQRLEEMDASLESKKSGMKEAEESLKSLQVIKNEKEMDMQAKEEKIKKHEGDLYQIKNNKEYQALQQEINSIKADVSLIEEAIIGLFDQIEASQVRFAEEKLKFEEERAVVEKEKEIIKNEERALIQQLSDLDAKRMASAGTIASEVLAQYQRILDKRGRAAVATIKEEFCGACNMHLRPQIINDAKLKKGIVLCESCARILYAEE
jgi:uncharacterized protein